jgi:hypothetical protein
MNTILQLKERIRKKKRDRTRKNALFQAASAAPSRLIVLHTDPGVFLLSPSYNIYNAQVDGTIVKKKACTFFLIQVEEGMLKTQTNGTRLYCFDHRIIFGISIAVLGCFS